MRNKLVIRLEKELRDDQITLLNYRFKDLVRSGRIHRTTALAKEADEPYLYSKPRISFTNNMRSAGRLNELILKINELG